MIDPMVPLPVTMATFYDLPSAVPFRFPMVESTRPTLVRLDELARRLEATTTTEPLPGLDDTAREQLCLFRRDWPDIEAVERYLSIGNARMAGRLADKLVAAHPRRPAGHFALGRAALLESRWQAAAEAFRTAHDLFPGSFDIERELILAMAACGDIKGARRAMASMDNSPEGMAFRRLFGPALEKGDVGALLARSAQLGRLQSFAVDGPAGTDRASVVAEIASAHPMDAPIMEVTARTALGIGQPELARTLADRSTRMDRHAADGWLVLSELALAEGDHPEAERTARMALSASPDSRPALLLLARVLRADNRPAQAAGLLRSACDRWPDDRSLRALLASSLLQSGERAAALCELEAAVVRWPGDPVGWFYLGRIAETAGDLARARTAYDTARGCAERFDEAREAAALLLARCGDQEAARRDLVAMTEEDPQSPFGWRGLGDLDLATGPSEAARCYAEALARRPGLGLSGVEHLAGLTDLNAGHDAAAVLRFEAAVRLDPRRHEAWCGLGVALHRAGRPDEAIHAMKEAARIEPNQTGYHANLAAFYQSAFRRNPVTHWRFLGLARQARRRSAELQLERQAIS